MAGFDYPVGKPDSHGRITATERSGDDDGYNTEAQDFGPAEWARYKGWYHLGEDWNGDSGGDGDRGDPVYSIADGTVRFAGAGGPGWGNVIIIEHPMPDGAFGGAVASMYAHLNSIAPEVIPGSGVDRGDIIGAIGDTGLDRSDPNVRSHLHFEIRDDEDIGTGRAYAPDISGRLDPSDFIAAHRSPVVEEPSGQSPVITGYDTFQEGDLIFLRINYTDPDGDADGFGFRGVKGSGWAEESHPFSDPSYGRVSEGTISYPFNHLATTDRAYESDVEAWIYDKEGLRSDPITVHLQVGRQEQREVTEATDPIPTDEVPFFILGGSNSELDPIGGTAM